MPIAGLEEFIFQIDFTPRKNFLQSSNSSYQYRSSNDLYTYFKTAILNNNLTMEVFIMK